MPPRDPNPKRPSPPPAEPLDWHGKRGAKPSAGGAAWQRPSAVVGHAKRPWLRIFVTGLLLVLVAFFVYEVIQSNEPTPLIACAFTGYELPLPPNAWAFEDVEDFKKHARPFSARSNLVWRGFDEEQRLPQTQWLEKLKKAIEQPSPKEDLPVLIYLSAHGVVDRAGRPCLVAPGAESKPEHWLHVEELVKELDQNATRKHRVILFLDANRLAAHWGLGVLYSDFADRLQNALDKAKAQNVLIVNSTSPGQVGWTSQKLGGSIFAQCVVNGLTGAASTDGNVVTLEDLLVYINFRGSHWTDENRGAIQNPLLIAPGAAQVDLKMKLAEVPSGWQERVFTMFAKRAPIDRALGGADKFDERIKESLEKSEAYWETLVKFIETGEPSETLFDALRLRRELAHWQQRMAAGNDEARMANDDFPALADRITKLTKRPPGARYSLWRDADDGDPELVAWRQCYDSHREESIDALRRQIPTSDGGERPEPIEWRWARMLAAENALRPPATKLL
ncbi:MAG TPA: caspase family protein, partial [Pirellulales bacterium]|nr:caspase family protein [Pirellulales bacterium]